jgi:hypothetical protein
MSGRELLDQSIELWNFVEAVGENLEIFQTNSQHAFNRINYIFTPPKFKMNNIKILTNGIKKSKQII